MFKRPPLTRKTVNQQASTPPSVFGQAELTVTRDVRSSRAVERCRRWRPVVMVTFRACIYVASGAASAELFHNGG